jgi:hypothetical protein
MKDGPLVKGYVPLETPDDHHLKYWYYRWRLRQNFMKIGKNGGESLIVQLRKVNHSDGDPILAKSNGVHHRFSDQTVFLGFYLGVLATEYYFLEKNNQNTNQTVKELYHALWALNRLDAGSKNYFTNVDPIPGDDSKGLYSNYKNYNGFLLRDDVDRAYFDFLHYNNSPIPSIYSSVPDVVHSDWGYHKYYIKGQPWFGKKDEVSLSEAFEYRKENGRNEMSLDQVIYLYVGLSLVNKYIPKHLKYYEDGIPQKFNGKDADYSSLLEVAQRITLRIASHCNATAHNVYFGNWFLRNKSRKGGGFFSDGKPVHDGSYMGALAFGIANSGCRILDKGKLKKPCKNSSFAKYSLGWLTEWLGGSSGVDNSVQNWWTHPLKGMPGIIPYSFGRDMGAVTTNAFNRHMANTLSALNNRRLNSLVHPMVQIISEKNGIFSYCQSIEASQTDYVVYLKKALFPKSSKIPSEINDKTFDLLSTAPYLGPYKYIDELSGELKYGNINWSTDNRLIHAERNGKNSFKGEYNGLDYMLYHNLYYLANQDEYTNAKNIFSKAKSIKVPKESFFEDVNPIEFTQFDSSIVQSHDFNKDFAPPGYFYDPYDLSDDEEEILDYESVSISDFDFFGNPTAYQLMGLDSLYNLDLTNKIYQINLETKNSFLDSVLNSNQSEILSIYPNPVDDQLNFSIPQIEDSPKIVTIKNSIGQSLKFFQFQADVKNSIDVDDLPSGVYILNVGTKQCSYSKKFIKI